MRMGEVDLGREMRNMVSNLEATKPDLSAAARIKRAWCSVADKGALEHTNAVFVIPNTDAKEVIIYVDTQIWATDLSLQSELYRLRLNMELQRVLESEGRSRHVKHDDALFDYEDSEHIRRLQFLPSKEKYASHHISFEEEQQQEAKSEVEPVLLDAAEQESLNAQVSAIEDPALRRAVYEAARANMEYRKGKRKAADDYPEFGVGV